MDMHSDKAPQRRVGGSILEPKGRKNHKRKGVGLLSVLAITLVWISAFMMSDSGRKFTSGIQDEITKAMNAAAASRHKQ